MGRKWRTLNIEQWFHTNKSPSAAGLSNYSHENILTLTKHNNMLTHSSLITDFMRTVDFILIQTGIMIICFSFLPCYLQSIKYNIISRLDHHIWLSRLLLDKSSSHIISSDFPRRGSINNKHGQHVWLTIKYFTILFKDTKTKE